jgi:hypothetical protein
MPSTPRVEVRKVESIPLRAMSWNCARWLLARAASPIRSFWAATGGGGAASAGGRADSAFAP